MQTNDGVVNLDYEEQEGSAPLNDETLFRKSDFSCLNQQTLEDIKKAFNVDAEDKPRKTIMTKINSLGFSLFRHRLLETNQLRIVQRNGIPELVTYSGRPERRTKVWTWWKPSTWFNASRDNSKTVAICSFEQLQNIGTVGYSDRHLVFVKQGSLAKAMIDGTPQLLQQGVHVIKTTNFRFDGLASQSEAYILHENCHRIQVPSGKIAAVLIDNKPHLLSAGLHCFRSNNVNFVKKGNALFHDSSDEKIECGTLLRLMPHAGTVAVYYSGSQICTYPKVGAQPTTATPLVLNNPLVKFKNFLSTNLLNRNYPKSEDRKQYYEYYTKDSVKVGVKLFVAYQITDPERALAKLDANMIDSHIEHLTHVDMSAAGQETSLQQIQSTDVGHITAAAAQDANPHAPSAPQFIRTWQDLVKGRLKEHLNEYGIELIRLNIEELKILNSDVEQKLGEQSYQVAEANAKLAAIGMQQEISYKTAQQEAEVNNIKVTQQRNQMRADAENQVEVAKLKKEAVIIEAEGMTKAKELEARVYENNPALKELEIARLFTTAFKATDKVLSVEAFRGLLSNGVFTNSVMTQMASEPMRQVANSK